MKNKMMRIASVLMVAALLSTCVISGTFAKYIKTASAEDTARVAKFGVVIEAKGEAFAEQYEVDDENLTEEEVGIVGEYSVKTSVEGEKLVAPGTSGDVAAITLTGTPEVAVRVSYGITIAAEGWEILPEAPAEEEAVEIPAEQQQKGGDTEEETAAGDEYFPIVITVNGTKYAIGTAAEEETPIKAEAEIVLCADLDELIEKVTEAVEGASAVYAPLTDLSSENVTGIAVSWEWPFETGADADEIAANDIKDTALGDQAAADNAATLTITVTATVTQID